MLNVKVFSDPTLLHLTLLILHLKFPFFMIYPVPVLPHQKRPFPGIIRAELR
jgi:hypothetical protein